MEMNAWVRKMVSIFKSAVIGGIKQYIADQDSFATADAKRRAALDKEKIARRLAKYKSGLRINEKNLGKASTDAIDPLYAYIDMPPNIARNFGLIGLPTFRNSEDHYKATVTKTAEGQALTKASHFSNILVPSILKKINDGSMIQPERSAASILSAFNGYVVTGKLNQARVDPSGNRISGIREADSFASLYKLANMFPDLPESKRFLSSFGIKVVFPKEYYENELLKEVINSTDSGGKISSYSADFPTTMEADEYGVVDEPTVKKYTIRTGYVPPSVIAFALSTLSNDIPAFKRGDFDYGAVSAGSDAENALSAEIIKRIRNGDIGSAEMSDGTAKAVNRLNYFGSLVSIGFRNYVAPIKRVEGDFTRYDRKTKIKRAEAQTVAIPENASLVTNIERLLEINSSIAKSFPSVTKISFARDVYTRFKNLIDVVVRDTEKQQDIGSVYSNENINEQLKDQYTSDGRLEDNDDLRIFVKGVRDKLSKRLNMYEKDSEEYNMVKEYNMLKIRIIFGVAKSIQGGTGGRGVSNMDFEAVAKSLANSSFSTLAEEEVAFTALLGLAKKQYLVSYFTQNEDIISSANVNKLVKKTLRLEKEYRKGVATTDTRRIEQNKENEDTSTEDILKSVQ